MRVHKCIQYRYSSTTKINNLFIFSKHNIKKERIDLPPSRGEQKKPRNRINQENRKKIIKKTEPKKKPIKPIKFFVKIFGLVRFQKPETGKTPTEPNRFGLRGTINSYKKNRIVFLNP